MCSHIHGSATGTCAGLDRLTEMHTAARCRRLAATTSAVGWQPWNELAAAAHTQQPTPWATYQHCSRWSHSIAGAHRSTSLHWLCHSTSKAAAGVGVEGCSAQGETCQQGSSRGSSSGGGGGRAGTWGSGSSSNAPWRQPSPQYPHIVCGFRSYSSSSSSSGAPPDPSQQDVVYKGAFSHALKRLKQVSLLNTGISLAAAPVFLLYADVDALTGVTLATSMVTFGVLTTSALHWFTSSYVHELRYTAASQSLDATTLTLLARQRHTHFQLSDVAYPDGLKPLATFKANNRVYYLDKDFPDKALLQLLTPPHPQAAVFEEFMKQQKEQH